VNRTTGELLFLRVPPRGLVEPAGGRSPFARAATFRSDGFRGLAGSLALTCFWVGLGRRVRTPGPELLRRLRDGSIAEMLDIGCAGALDPGLRQGDLLLSTDDLPFDAAAPVPVHRRPEPAGLVQEVAARRGVGFRRAGILTHERAVLRRAERLLLFEHTGCGAVQMEHAWFLLRLRSLLPEACFARLRVTHLVLITDAVPAFDGRRDTVTAAWDAVRGYGFQGGRGGIASLRRDLLSRWPGA
jgi:hypothetical protein